MKKLKLNNSFDKKHINILKLEFEEDENKNNISSITVNKVINSQPKKNNIKKISNLLENINSNISFDEQQNKKEKKNLNNSNNLSKSEIKKSELEFNKSDYKDKSCKNWDEVKSNYINHIQNEQILNKLENENINKRYFNENKRNYYFGRKKINNLPYIYDISSTYMNKYYNKSEHKRHEILIDELCKLRAYLLKYPNNNNIDIIKDFLIKYNIQNLDKYSNFQLLQLGKFVCQEDIYKINSLLKPYLHVKDMIYDILENSIKLNNKFSGFKFDASIEKLLNKIDSNKKFENNKNNITPNKITDNKNKNRKNSSLNMKSSTIFYKRAKIKNNKKFYISELDYNYNTNVQNNEVLKKNNNKIWQNNNKEKYDEIKNQNQLEFINYSQKRKDLLEGIGISIKKQSYDNFNDKDLYSSPLLNKNRNNNKKYYQINVNKIYQKRDNNILPRINFKITPYYKPNKLLLAPDKNYCFNFDLLLKDISKELKNFELTYQHKLDLIGKRNLSPNNSNIFISKVNEINSKKTLQNSKSCDLININEADKLKKMEAINRLYYGKKSIKIDLDDIQKKHKLTEYIALANAKTHVKNDIINNNILKLYK